MFNIQELVNYLNSELNGIDTTNAYSFNIYAEVGEQKNDGSINGVLRTAGNETSKIKGNIETHYTFVCEMPIATPRANAHFLGVKNIVEQFVNANNGSQLDLSDGKAVLHISMGIPKNFQVADNTGDTVPLYFTIEALYTENSITNADKHWLLGNYEKVDGVYTWVYYEIPYTNENVLVDKDGITRKINGKDFTQTFLTGQTKYYKFVFPYQNTELGKLIQTELLSGKFQKEFKLKYYDGASFTEANPFETRVSIFKNGDTGSETISVSKFNLTFADVDDGSGDWTYQLALIDNRFDNQTEDTRWFNSQAEQQAYYESKIALSGNCGYETIKAPNLNSIDITSQVYPNNTGYNVFDLTNKNYAIIKALRTVGQLTETRYFYYYVKNAQIGADGQVLFDLELDTVQTYLFNERLEFGDCLVERSSLNRFVTDFTTSLNNVKFDGSVDSKLFAREQIQNVAKRLTNRTKLGACNTNTTTVNNWINNFVIGWIYCFVSPTKEISVKLFNDKSSSTTSTPQNIKLKGLNLIGKVGNGIGTIPNPLPCIVIPVLKSRYVGSVYEIARLFITDEYGRDLEIASSIDYNINSGITSQFFSQVLQYISETFGTDNIYSVKFSTYCPFGNDNIIATINDDGVYNDLVIRFTDVALNGKYYFETTYTNNELSCYQIDYTDANSNTTKTGGLLVFDAQPPNYNLGNYTVNKTLSFNKNNIIGAEKNPDFNPKLLSQDYFELQVCDETENGFSYDLQKLNKNSVQIGITETLTPDNTKKYIRITNNDGIYNAETSQNLLGFVNNNDQTVVIASTQYSNMLANNKNFFTQNELGRWESLLPGVAGGIAQIGLGALNPATIVGGVSQIVGSLSGYVTNTIKQDMTIDNLKNAPSSIKNAQGNIILNATSSNIGVIVEEYDILPQEKKVINDYMVQYGFSTNQIGQIKDYLNKNGKNARRYFNYIQAVINSISGIAMSNTARDNLRQRFAKGIRFWRDDNVDYDKENYELWLEDNLNGTTWLFNDDINWQTIYGILTNHEITMNFTSNEVEYTGLRIELVNGNYEVYYVKGNTATNVCVRNGTTNTWENDAYKKIEIATGNTDAQITSVYVNNAFRNYGELLSIERTY